MSANGLRKGKKKEAWLDCAPSSGVQALLSSAAVAGARAQNLFC